MNKTAIGVWTTTAALVCLSAVASSSANADTPSQTGCAAAYDRLAVADLEALSSNYHLPGILDDPANGGNGDGFVCGKPFNQQATENVCGNPCAVPILYNFYEDDLTPAH